MDPDSVKSTLSNLAFGNVMAAAARDYKKELLTQEKAQASSSINQEVDLDELMDDPELEKLHADRIAALKREAEKRQEMKKQGHGEYREITEGDFLGEVTQSEKVICHFYHREFYRCKIMDKHLKSLAPRHLDTKFIKLDAENAPFFVTKLGIKTLPCVILFREIKQSFPYPVLEMETGIVLVFKHEWLHNERVLGTMREKFESSKALKRKHANFHVARKGIAVDRLVGFQDLGGKDDFTTKALENHLIKKGMISEKKNNEHDEDDDYPESRRRNVRSSVAADSDSD